MNSEIMIDLRNYDLADRLKVDMISVGSLLSELEDALNEIDILKGKIEELERPYSAPDEFDIWHDKLLEEE